MVSITPGATLEIGWDDPLSDGCLPLKNYRVTRNGVGLAPLLQPGSNVLSDAIPAASFPIGTVITYTVAAINAAGTSVESVPLSVTVGSVPNAPTGLTVASHPTETSAVLQWSSGAAIASNQPTLAFNVYVDDLSGNQVVPTSTTSPTFEATGLTLGNTYQVQVTAVNAIGESAASAVVTLHTGVPPTRLTGTRSPRLESSTASAITIAWLPPAYNGGASLSEYRVYYDIGQTGTFSAGQVVLPSAPTKFTLDATKPGAAALATG